MRDDNGLTINIAGLSRLLAAPRICQRRRISSVVDIIPSASQDMALKSSANRIQISSSDLSTDCQTALCNSSNLEVAMLHRDL